MTAKKIVVMVEWTYFILSLYHFHLRRQFERLSLHPCHIRNVKFNNIYTVASEK